MQFIENNYTSQIEKMQNENKDNEKKLKEQYEKIIQETKEELNKEKQSKEKEREIQNNNKKEIEKIKNDITRKEKTYQEKITSMQNELKEKEALIQKQKDEMESSNINIQKKLDLSQKREKELQALKKSLKEEKATLESKHREELDRVSFQHTLAINEIQLKLDSQISKLKIENIQLKEQLENSNKSNAKINDDKLDSINSKIEDISSIVNAIKVQFSDINTKDDKEIASLIRDELNQKLLLIQNNNSMLKIEVANIKSSSNSNASTANSILHKEDRKGTNSNYRISSHRSREESQRY